MWTNKKNVVLVIAGAFLASFAAGMYSGNIASEEDTVPNREPRKNGFNISKKTLLHASSTSEAEVNNDIITFMEGLKKTQSLDELHQALEEASDPARTDPFQSDIKKWMIMQKWGEIAPHQGLQKLEEMKNGTDLLFPLFAGWASKNPEAATSFYETNYIGKSHTYSSRILNAIVSEYAAYSPEKAWNWLQSIKDSIPTEEFEKSKKKFLQAASQKNPQDIPQYITEVGYADLGEEIYYVGMNWGNHDLASKEWINQLPDNIRPKAEAGRIMGITKGNLEEIDKLLLETPPKDQLAVKKELARSLRDIGGPQMQSRISWIIDSLPEEAISQDQRDFIGSWLQSDRKDGKEWIDSLPSGKKKDFLQKCYTN